LFPMRRRCQHVAALVCMCVGLAASAGASETTFSITPTGRLHWDASRHDSEFRRLWLGGKGHLGALDYKAVADLSALEHEFTRDHIKLKDLWLRQPLGPGALMLGQFKQAFSLEGQTSSNVGSFMERPGAINALAPGYRKAIGWQMASARGSLAASAWRLQSIGRPELAGFGLGTRLTFAPRALDGDVHHLGLSFAHEHHDHPGTHGAPALNLRPRTSARLSRAVRPIVAVFSDGLDTAVDKWSLEYARVYGAWSWQGEFSGGLLDDGSEHARLLAGYSALSWFVSGHARRYDVASGRFMRVQGVFPNAPGWELALRYERMHGRQRDKNGLDRIDLSVSVLTLASNWYLRPNLRLMLNLVMNHERDHLTRASDHARELIGRVHYDF